MLDEQLNNSSSIVVAIHESMFVGCNSDDKKLNPFAGHTHQLAHTQLPNLT